VGPGRRRRFRPSGLARDEAFSRAGLLHSSFALCMMLSQNLCGEHKAAVAVGPASAFGRTRTRGA
jgi:hypothetical protein